MKIKTHCFTNCEYLYEKAADFIIAAIKDTLATKSYCTMALAGGKTPVPLYSLLSSPASTAKIPWEKILFFLGDERFVAINHPDSNLGMIKKSLFAGIPDNSANIHPLQTSLPTPEDAARAYETTIRDTFKHLTLVTKNVDSDQMPCFDLVLLGLGTDGHTASLFPETPAVSEQQRLVCAVNPPPSGLNPHLPRITLTLPLINNADTIIFLVTDPNKAGIVEEILNCPQPTALPYPAAQVHARKIHWFYIGREQASS